MTIKVGRGSWLSITNLLKNDDGTVFWDQPNFPQIVPQPKDTYLTISSDYVGRLDLIAFDYYGDVDLWWVIALANGIDLIPTEVTIGLKIRIPDKKYVESILSKGPQ
jgi:hypothetical protein